MLWQKSECWEWTRYKARNGYGKIWFKGKTWYVHRLFYTICRGPIADGLELDHLCRNRWCCNPDHLEAVTRRENALRGVGIPALNAAKTHCIRGHPYSSENTYTCPRNRRYCIACKRTYLIQWRAERKLKRVS